MPHQCVRCGEFYEDGSNQILSGCKCGGKNPCTCGKRVLVDYK